MPVFDDIADRFDHLWRQGDAPEISIFLELPGVTAELRRGVLTELIAIDLEYRWRAGRAGRTSSSTAIAVSESGAAAPQTLCDWRPLLEEYIERWPELGPAGLLSPELIAEEYRVRHRWGDCPPFAEYVERFGEREDLRRLLESTRQELLLEGADRQTCLFEETQSAQDAVPFEPRRFGRYALLRRLGSGGMGEVYLAEDSQLERLVALKMPRLTGDSPALRERFLVEARSAAALRHPGLCPVFDAGDLEGQPFLTMAFIEGETLRTRWQKGELRSMREALPILIKVAEALHCAHEAGIIHRDLKPSNVMIDAHGQPIVMDFGLAVRGADEAGDFETVGSPAFMSPEQVTGGAALGPASDIYSLGVLLFELLTGRLPFLGSTNGILHQILHSDPPLPSRLQPGIDAELEQLCLQMLAKRPEHRPASMREVADRLADAEARSAGERRRETGSRQRARARAAFAVAAVTLTLMLAAGLLLTPGITTHPDRSSQVRREPSVDSGRQRLDLPPPAVAPFEASEARRHQETWAAALDVPRAATNSIGMELTLIPPGEFRMGTVPAAVENLLRQARHLGLDPLTIDFLTAEDPEHRVVLTTPFYLGTFEVTQREFEVVTGANPSQFSSGGALAEARKAVVDVDTAAHPVENVSWFDAVRFCNALSRREGLPPYYALNGDDVAAGGGAGYRLPTESEWEYACRAGTVTRFSFDDREERLRHARYRTTVDPPPSTGRVGAREPNPFGLYDMHGNVWEWCQDWYAPDAYARAKLDDAPDPRGPASGTRRVARGGSWTSPLLNCRCATRRRQLPSFHNRATGFRVARSLLP